MEPSHPIEGDRGLICPIRTYADGESGNEIRGYKLGKQKFSYNGISLLLEDSHGPRKILSAVETPMGKEINVVLKHSCLKYLLQLDNGTELCAYIFLVFATNLTSDQAQASSVPHGMQRPQVEWQLVTRRDCHRGCEGPMLQGIRRFGKAAKCTNEEKTYKARDPSKVYIAVDEACAHMDSKAERFRLVLGLYSGKEEVATAVSAPIRILANNDAPRGAASFTINCNYHGSETPGTFEQAKPRPALQDVKVNVERTRPVPKPQNKPVDQCKGKDDNGASSKDLLPKRTTVPSRKPSIPFDSWSLTSIVERLLKRFGNRVGSLLYLASLAEELDVKKRRLYDVMNVLESVQIVQRKAQDMYVWKAASSVQEAYDALALEAEMKRSMAESDTVQSSPEAVQAGTQPRTDVHSFKSLKMLSEEFVQLFLAEQGQVLQLDRAVSSILGNQNENAQAVRRRLYDVANVLSCLHLVVKLQTPQGPGYLWLGIGGFQERLCEISGVPARAAAAPSRKRKSTDSVSTSGPALQLQTPPEPRAPKRRVVEPPPGARHARLPSDDFADGFLARSGFRIQKESPPESPRPTNNRQPLSPISLPARHRSSETTSASKRPPLPSHPSPGQNPPPTAGKPPQLTLPPGAAQQQGQPVTSPTLTYNAFETFQPGRFPTPFTLPFRKAPGQSSSVLRPAPRRLSGIPPVHHPLSPTLRAAPSTRSAESEPCCTTYSGLGYDSSQPGGRAPSDFTPYKQRDPLRLCSDAPFTCEAVAGMTPYSDVQVPVHNRSGLPAPVARYPSFGKPQAQEWNRNESRAETQAGGPPATWNAHTQLEPPLERLRAQLATSVLRMPRRQSVSRGPSAAGWTSAYPDTQNERPLELLNNVTQALLLLRDSALTSNGGEYTRALSEARTRILPHVRALALGRQEGLQSRLPTRSSHDDLAVSQPQR